MKYYRNNFFLLISALLLINCTDEEKALHQTEYKSSYEWDAIADASQHVLEEQFWRPAPNNYYWIDNIYDTPTFYHYWQTAHAMETVMDAYVRTQNNLYKERTRVILDRIRKKEGGVYTTWFYDDMAWMGIACLRAYQLFKDDEYMVAAESLLTDIKKGWIEDGGMLWNKDPSEKDKRNACTNWTVSCFAARMYLINQKKEDRDFALKVYKWAKSNLYEESLGATFSSSTQRTYMTYNQGVLIGASLALYDITKQIYYLNIATKCADFSIKNDRFAKEGIWRDEGDKDGLNQNNGIFKGILVHYMVDFIRCQSLSNEKRQNYVQYLEKMAVTLYEATKHNFLFPGDWRRAADEKERIYLGCEMSGIILFESVAIFLKEYPELLKNVTAIEKE